MYFNVLKGAFPSLQQIDKALDVGSDETGLVRGSAMYIDGSGTVPVFRVAGAAQASDPTAYIYFSLIPQDDFTAGMAGTIGQGPSGGVARVNGLACGMNKEAETDMYLGETDGTYNSVFVVGKLLTVADGGLLAPHSSGKNCVGVVTKAVHSKWVNNAWAVTGRRTGANVNVLTFQSMWIPKLVTA